MASLMNFNPEERHELQSAELETLAEQVSTHCFGRIRIRSPSTAAQVAFATTRAVGIMLACYCDPAQLLICIWQHVHPPVESTH